MDLGIKIAILGASLSIFLEFCFSYGNIFSCYYRFITAYFRYGLKRQKSYFVRPSKVPKYKIYLFKILGGCIYCNNVYLTAGNYVIAAFPDFSYIDCLLSIALSHVFLQLYYKYYDSN
jgi:hypothetical protein